MPNRLVIVAVLFALLSLFLLGMGFAALKRRRLYATASSLILALLLLSLAALCATISIATQGYRALTHEEVAALVTTEPTGPQRFTARFRFPDGREAAFSLAGDELYVDAHILKWKSIANFFGVHTAYELDRVAGRYAQLTDERAQVRTVFALSRQKPVDLFHLRLRYAALTPLVDAEYGSATFVTADSPGVFEVRVSTSGLLIRKAASGDR
jgi:hypothetical protein